MVKQYTMQLNIHVPWIILTTKFLIIANGLQSVPTYFEALPKII
jgi:hypothetical protein